MKLINVVTLGCSKNVVDSEHMMAQAEAAGWQVTFDSNSTRAKVVVIILIHSHSLVFLSTFLLLILLP